MGRMDRKRKLPLWTSAVGALCAAVAVTLLGREKKRSVPVEDWTHPEVVRVRLAIRRAMRAGVSWRELKDLIATEDELFKAGLWVRDGHAPEDALQYQDRLRQEWDR